METRVDSSHTLLIFRALRMKSFQRHTLNITKTGNVYDKPSSRISGFSYQLLFSGQVICMSSWAVSACFHPIYSYIQFSLYDLLQLVRRDARKLHMHLPCKQNKGYKSQFWKITYIQRVKKKRYLLYNFMVSRRQNTYTSRLEGKHRGKSSFNRPQKLPRNLRISG